MDKNRIINAAVGIVMERCCMPQDVAFEKLRAFARSQRRSLDNVAMELVNAVSTTNAILHNLE
jgi:response regulator NasT